MLCIGQTDQRVKRNRFPAAGVLTADSLYLYLISRVRNEVRQCIGSTAQVLHQRPIGIRRSLVLQVVSSSRTNPVDGSGICRYVVCLHRFRFVASRTCRSFRCNGSFPTGSRGRAIRMPLNGERTGLSYIIYICSDGCRRTAGLESSKQLAVRRIAIIDKHVVPVGTTG